MKKISLIILFLSMVSVGYAQEVRYDFKFDWIAVYKTNPSFNPLNGLDIYGIGWCRLFVKNKTTGNEDQIMPTGFKYLANNGRVLEISRKNAIRFDKNLIENTSPKTLSNTKVRFQFDPKKYDYNTTEEVLDNAYFKVVFEVKERGIIAKTDDIIGKKEAVIMIRDANVPAKNATGVQRSSNSASDEGFIRYNKDKLNIGVFYSIVPVQ